MGVETKIEKGLLPLILEGHAALHDVSITITPSGVTSNDQSGLLEVIFDIGFDTPELGRAITVKGIRVECGSNVTLIRLTEALKVHSAT